MNDAKIEVSNSDIVPRPNSDCSSNFQASVSSDLFLDDMLRTCTHTHTHTCNPHGPDDAAHTHTCYHTHTRVIPSDGDNVVHDGKSPVSNPRRPLGNREAVRKYREKKKAHTANLEEEVKKLREMNQVLMAKLQRQTILETEISRLRCLLGGLRGRIDDELRERECDSVNSFKEGECVSNLSCNLGDPYVTSKVIGRCGETTARCEANTNYLESAEKCLVSSSTQEGD